ncbi:serine/threonine protein kinase [Pendulispora rubella]|uniref:Serine/threonine protein kinase n=1 Tax=Pendulispora rubella TaxID=2741070 RepID=A0ABZ2L526_9BACT
MQSSSERALARVGTSVHQCRLERLIGIGGMGAVYAATHRDGHRVAIKVMLERFRDDPSICHLFEREAAVANQVGHPGAVPVLEHHVGDDGCAFLIMPLLEGETLRARWERAGKRLPVSEVAVLMADVLDVLASAHTRGLVHRDIKPENLFVTAAGEVRVLDFGIARRIDPSGTSTICGNMIGTPAFMPPEQALGKSDAIGPHSDCWAVGATIFTLLSGQLVHPAETNAEQLAAAATRHARSLADAAPHLPRAIVKFVDASLAFEPEQRWRSAREMRDALLVAFETALGEPVPALAMRTRPVWVSELSREAEQTYANATPGADAAERKNAAPPRGPAGPARNLSGIEVDVDVILANLHLVPSSLLPIYLKYGLASATGDGTIALKPERWWPFDAYVACEREICTTLGPAKSMELARLFALHYELPPSMRDIHGVMRALDIAYHARHRKDGKLMVDEGTLHVADGIGHIRYRGEPGENLIALEVDMDLHCDWQRGCLLGIARRFEPHSLVDHASGPCRKYGDPHCVYHVTWW